MPTRGARSLAGSGVLHQETENAGELALFDRRRKFMLKPACPGLHHCTAYSHLNSCLSASGGNESPPRYATIDPFGALPWRANNQRQAMGIIWTTVRQDDPFGRGFYYVPFSDGDVYGPINELWG